MDSIGVQLSKNTAKSINLGHRSTGNFILITIIFAYLEIALPDLFIGPF